MLIPFINAVKCAECRCFLEKGDAYKVTESSGFWIYGSRETKYYCLEHRKPYSRMNVWRDGCSYYGEIQMNEDGTPVGYVKAKKK